MGAQNENLKRRFIQYNLDDCAALRVVTEYVHSLTAIGQTAKEVKPRDRATEDSLGNDIPMQSSRRDWGGPGFCPPRFRLHQQVCLFRLPAREGISSHESEASQASQAQ